MSRVTDLLERIIGRSGATYYAASGATRPEGRDGDTLEDPATGNTYKWYGGRWHLKTLGTYTDIKFDATFVKGDLASAVDPATKEVTYDKTYGDLATTTPETGYELAGWFLDADLTNEVDKDSVVITEEAHNLYAKHVPIVYDITYELDGGTNGDNPDTFTVLTPTIELADAEKEGYTFGGWFSDVALTQAVTEIALGSHADITLYAKFTAIEYDITYNLDGGTNGANPATYTIETATITLADATKEGFTFLGWFSDAELTTEVTEIPLGSTGDVALYAGWEVVG